MGQVGNAKLISHIGRHLRRAWGCGGGKEKISINKRQPKLNSI